MKVINGNIFATTCQTIVNTVNCDGHMGKGLALECKILFPLAYEQYHAACASSSLTIGDLLLSNAQDPWVLHFPTKRHWQHPSRLTYIEQGLERFVTTHQDLGIESVAFPVLGSLNGGLDPDLVLLTMERYLSNTGCTVEVYQHDPTTVAPHMLDLARRIAMLGESTFASKAKVKSTLVKDVRLAIEQGWLTSFSKLLEQRGVGLQTVTRIAQTHRDLIAVAQQTLF